MSLKFGLRILTIILIVVSIAWFILLPGPEPLTVFIGAVIAGLASLRDDDKPKPEDTDTNDSATKQRELIKAVVVEVQTQQQTVTTPQAVNPALDTHTFNDIVQLLTPHCGIDQREALVQAALHGCNVLHQIDWTGSADEFTVRLVTHLLNFGDCEPGQPALGQLLATLKTRVGVNRHAPIDQLIRYIQPITQTPRQSEIAYLQHVIQQYERWQNDYTDLAGIARIAKSKIPVKSAAKRQQIEMHLRLYEQVGIDAEKGKITEIENFAELREGIRKYQRVALIGDPGAGKTTTLERLAYELATAALAEVAETGNFQAPLPLFVRLGTYNGADFATFLAASLHGLTLADYLPQRLFLLLDGLNEMPAEHLNSIEAWIRANPQVKLIVSCRKLDYVERKLPLQRVDVAPLDLARIRLFMANYLEDADRETLFWALAGHDVRRAWHWYQRQNDNATYTDFFHGEDEPGNPWQTERKILDVLRLRQRFHENAAEPTKALPDMLGVVTNPFLLDKVIDIFLLQGEPPRNKGDLFRIFVTQLINERGKLAISSAYPWLDENLQQQALAALAYRMQTEKTGTSVSLDFVLATFQQAAPTVNADELRYFAISASILEQGATLRFSHQLLQEYFAAFQMGVDLKNGVAATDYFPADDWWLPTGWEETALLLAGMEKDATAVVTWLTPVQPDLAYRIATESGAECADAAKDALYQPKSEARRSFYALAEWGRNLADNDPRPGVGLIKSGKGQGLPDIAWGKPVSPATYTIGGDVRAFSPLEKQAFDLKYSYELAKYPVTMAQFQAFIDAPDGMRAANTTWWDDIRAEKEPYEQYNQYANHPRENVTWYQAVAFCRWLTAKYRAVGLLDARAEIRLPTEIEWEIAARYPDGCLFPWGDDFRPGHANCDEQEQGDGPYFLNQTTAVALYENGKQPHLDLYDLSGNVWEWTLSKWDDGSSVIDKTNSSRVLRGGSFINGTNITRAASRAFGNPLPWNFNIGFRVSRFNLGF